MRAAVLAVALASVAALSGCEREKRDFEPPTGSASGAAATRNVSVRAGPGEPIETARLATTQDRRDEYNAFLVNQGKRLFRWYNCNGCHAQGGGNMGPPLMDDKWLYGHRPAEIYASIVEGRPKGMPAFGGRIPEDQLWQLVAYVRSLSGQLRKDVAPSRADGLAGAPPENVRDIERPVQQPAPKP
jgi:cytochrome c oxidase cbb3-type subunit III